MVGAGFSRNAEPLGSSVGLFPLWSDLGGRMYTELYPADTDPASARRSLALAGNGPVRLASEYEAAFGREQLDGLVQAVIPNDSYSPGRLHRLLMILPWADVFTTNYDTLLERTGRQVHRRYDLVQTAADLPGRMKPRIIKLHGSFPSHRPFILTEEDYRTYPANFSPMVNSVQQAMLEGVVCLIGFSGEDANFLYWSGWVRDNLQSASPRIYLLGLLNLTSAQRSLLERRNVVAVDLSPLFSRQDWPDPDVRHSKALEWLLLSLHRGQTPDPLQWPSSHLPVTEAPSAGLPDLLPPPRVPAGPGPLYPTPRQPNVGTIGSA